MGGVLNTLPNGIGDAFSSAPFSGIVGGGKGAKSKGSLFWLLVEFTFSNGFGFGCGGGGMVSKGLRPFGSGGGGAVGGLGGAPKACGFAGFKPGSVGESKGFKPFNGERGGAA